MIGEITALAWLHIPALAARRNSVGQSQPGDQELSGLSTSRCQSVTAGVSTSLSWSSRFSSATSGPSRSWDPPPQISQSVDLLLSVRSPLTTVLIFWFLITAFNQVQLQQCQLYSFDFPFQPSDYGGEFLPGYRHGNITGKMRVGRIYWPVF